MVFVDLHHLTQKPYLPLLFFCLQRQKINKNQRLLLCEGNALPQGPHDTTARLTVNQFSARWPQNDDAMPPIDVVTTRYPWPQLWQFALDSSTNYPTWTWFPWVLTMHLCPHYPSPTLPHSAPCPTAAGRVAPRIPGRGPKQRSCRPDWPSKRIRDLIVVVVITIVVVVVLLVSLYNACIRCKYCFYWQTLKITAEFTFSIVLQVFPLSFLSMIIFLFLLAN